MIVDNNFNKWNINKLPRNKGAQGASGSNGIVTLTTGNREGKGYPELEAHYLWGQFFNGKQDVNGDITTDGNVNFHGNLNFLGEYDSDDDLRGNLNIGNVNAVNGHFKEMNNDILKAAEAYINNLTVTGSAHFFELIIDKIRSVGGAIMLTPGDGFELWGYNLSDEKNINLWWVCDDVKGVKYNHWQVGDQALCKSFDESVIGESTYTSNKYWWAKVVGVNESSTWCVKLGADEYNPDLVTVLPNPTYYNNTHSYLRKTDFIPSDKYVYVEKKNRANWISNEEYFNLSASDKSKYEYSQLYIHQNDDGSVIQITKLQYDNDNNDPIDPNLLVYDKKEKSWRILRDFCKADCKSCFSITIDKTQCSPGSKFSVSGSNYTAYVFREGDNIVMLGNQTDENRQNAIYLNAGGQGDSLDTDLRPPFFAQYKGINDFDLMSHRLTWFSGGWVGAQGTQGYANNIQGNLKIATGESVEDYVGSEIIAQSDAITMRVKSDISEAGITIHDDEIILDADKTTVTGTLQLNDDKTGLVLYDNNVPVISIQNESVKVTSQYQYMAINPNVNNTTNYVDFCNYDVSDQFSTHRVVISTGNYSLGPITIRCANKHLGNSYYSISKVELKIDLYKWSTNEFITTVYNGTTTPSSASTTINISPQAFTSSYSGDVYFKVTKCKVTFGSNYALNSPEIQVNGNLSVDVNLLTKIGNDGAKFMTNGSNKYVEYSNGGYTMKWGDQKIEMKNVTGKGNVLYRTVEHPRSGGTGFGDIGSMLSVRIIEPQTGTSMDDRDGFVVIKGTWNTTGYPLYTLMTPSTSNGTKGRRVFIKNMTNQTLTIKVVDGSTKIIDAKASSPVDKLTIGADMCYFICDGEYWYFGYCG